MVIKAKSPAHLCHHLSFQFISYSELSDLNHNKAPDSLWRPFQAKPQALIQSPSEVVTEVKLGLVNVTMRKYVKVCNEFVAKTSGLAIQRCSKLSSVDCVAAMAK